MTQKAVTMAGGGVIGWVSTGGCEHERCIEQVRAGRHYHAIPREGTLENYHYPTADEATDAIRQHARSVFRTVREAHQARVRSVAQLSAGQRVRLRAGTSHFMSGAVGVVDLVELDHNHGSYQPGTGRLHPDSCYTADRVEVEVVFGAAPNHLRCRVSAGELAVVGEKEEA